MPSESPIVLSCVAPAVKSDKKTTMEKFAVDLEKILDDFELLEDQSRTSCLQSSEATIPQVVLSETRPLECEGEEAHQVFPALSAEIEAPQDLLLVDLSEDLTPVTLRETAVLGDLITPVEVTSLVDPVSLVDLVCLQEPIVTISDDKEDLLSINMMDPTLGGSLAKVEITNLLDPVPPMHLDLLENQAAEKVSKGIPAINLVNPVAQTVQTVSISEVAKTTLLDPISLIHTKSLEGQDTQKDVVPEVPTVSSDLPSVTVNSEGEPEEAVMIKKVDEAQELNGEVTTVSSADPSGEEELLRYLEELEEEESTKVKGGASISTEEPEKSPVEAAAEDVAALSSDPFLEAAPEVEEDSDADTEADSEMDAEADANAAADAITEASVTDAAAKVDAEASAECAAEESVETVEAGAMASSSPDINDPYGDDSTASLASESTESGWQDSMALADADLNAVVEDPPEYSNPYPAYADVAVADLPDGSSAPLAVPEPYSSLTDDERMLGLLKPVWIADEDAPQCMDCGQRFTVLRRRHHCRACGRVLCAACCSSRAPIQYMDGRQARVCLSCLQVLQKVEAYKKWGDVDQLPAVAAVASSAASSNSSSSPSSSTSTPASSPSSGVAVAPAAAVATAAPVVRVNPNNPAEYCSTIPPALQAAAAALPPPSVLVPVGVLKKEGSSSQSRSRSDPPKQVIFSDGIRPGGDLAELDSWRMATAVEPVASASSAPHAGSRGGGQRRRAAAAAQAQAAAPAPAKTSLAVPTSKVVSSGLPAVADSAIDSAETLAVALADAAKPPVTFVLPTSHQQQQHVLKVRVKLLQLDCCARRRCWSLTTEGMRWASQDELLLLLEQLDAEETLPPADLFLHLHSIFKEALINHHHVVNLGHTVTPGTFLGSTEHGGFLFFRTSLQCVQQLSLPAPPYLVGVLLQRWEIPWAKVFPLRLLLRLGAEFRYYPAPLFSVRHRKPVFGEIGHTIVNLLADMRNFSYSLPSVPGLLVHMEERETNIVVPRSRYSQVCKALAQSNDHVLSLAASFSPIADAHLVCLQLDDGSYQTQAINIQHSPRKVTGASFVVFNGALKSPDGLTGRSSIVEDGVMVQLLPNSLEALKQAMIRMEDFVVLCGKVGAEQPEETVTLRWVDTDPSPVNMGVVSPIDGRDMSGVSSIRVMQHRYYKGEGRLLRWSELFILQTEQDGGQQQGSARLETDASDVTRLAEAIAKAACTALTARLAALQSHSLVALRVSIDNDSVEYQAGAAAQPLPGPCTAELDSSLVPLLHRESAARTLPCVLELWFRIVHP